jgi:hypothetical protein
MDILIQELGKAMSAREVADYLGLDIKTVRKYYLELGGMRLGSHYRFFEKEICNAVQKKKQMDSPSENVRNQTRESVLHTEGGAKLGSNDAEKTSQRIDREDRHRLFS